MEMDPCAQLTGRTARREQQSRGLHVKYYLPSSYYYSMYTLDDRRARHIYQHIPTFSLYNVLFFLNYDTGVHPLLTSISIDQSSSSLGPSPIASCFR
jgi:hypothetical protein